MRVSTLISAPLLVAALTSVVSAQPRLPKGVNLEADVSYAANDNPRQRLDLLLPTKRSGDGPLPVIAFIHGGAWLTGDKVHGRGRVAPFVASGKFVGVSIGYRLSKEAIWPAQIHDCKAAIRWLRGNAKKYGIDPDRIAVWGSSAGGHLVAMLGVTGDVPALEGKVGKHLARSSRVTCVLDFFGPTDFSRMSAFESRMDHDAPNSPESLLVGGPVQKMKAQVRSANTIAHVSKSDAPTLIAHGSKDPLVPHNQSVIFDAALKKAGVESVFITMTGGGHGFRSAELDRRVRRFLEKHLLGAKDANISAESISIERSR